ncbi:MAG: anaerobic sulfatase maturase [Ignavibacteria bacterium]
MQIVVNDQPVDEKLIDAEIERMKPDYENQYRNQPQEQKEKQLREWAQENVIERILLLQEARKDPRPISKELVEEAFNSLVQQSGGFDSFMKDVGDRKVAIEEIKDDFEKQLRIERLIKELNDEIEKPRKSQAEKFYKKNRQKYFMPEMVRASHIVIHVNTPSEVEEAKKKIDDIYAKILEGSSFEELADQNSDCPGNGGDLGYFPRGQMVRSFEDVVFNLKVGEVSEVFQSEFGFHIAKVYDKRYKRQIPFEKVEEKIRTQLWEEAKSKNIEAYLDKLRASAKINYLPVNTAKAGQARIIHKFIKPLSSVLVKPAGPDCNLDCDYCFYLEKAELFGAAKQHRMSTATLEEMIKQIMTQGESQVSFGWQGGEPTIMGLNFFKKVVEFQEKYSDGKTVGNGLQTNGTLINKEWAKFLHDYNFLVGLSIDGQKEIHDYYRKTKGRQGSWDKVNSSLKLLLDNEVQVNALTVVNNYSAQFPKEIYNFHKSNGLTFHQYIPCVGKDPNDESKVADFSVSPKQFGEFLCTLFDLWTHDFKDGIPTTSIRYFDSVFYNYVGLQAPECTLLVECGNYVVIEHNGDVYSCDFFVEPAWRLGNLHQDTIRDMLNSDKQYEFGKMKSSLPQKCKECKYLKYCWGGCTKDRVNSNDPNKVSHFCESYLAFFEHADKQMKKMADRWKKDNANRN